MMLGNGFSPFGLVFVLLYLAVVIYVLIQIGGMNKSLKRIADSLDNNHKPSGDDSSAG